LNKPYAFAPKKKVNQPFEQRKRSEPIQKLKP